MTCNKILSLFLSLLLVAPTSFAKSRWLSQSSLLEKASQRIRGKAETFANLQKADSLNPTDFKTFYENQVELYLKDPQSPLVFTEWVFEMLQLSLKIQNEPYSNFVSFNQEPLVKTSTKALIEDIWINNQPWDQLLLAREYRYKGLTPSPLFFESILESERLFFQDLSQGQFSETESKADSQGLVTVEGKVVFPESNLNVAGVISTPTFFQRYNTTALNRNRRRAAAIFKLFLCDSMSPVIPTDADKEANDSGKLIGDIHGEKQISDGMKANLEAQHGQDPQCKACHYKLDPMGKAFEPFGLTPKDYVGKGMVTFRRINGTKVEEPFLGLAGLARKVIAQPEYLQCQVRHFWDQYIGIDIPLTSKKSDKVQMQFSQKSLGVRDLVRALVLSDDFRYRKFDEDFSYDDVAGVLRSCTQCHNSQEIPPLVPTLGEPENKFDLSHLPTKYRSDTILDIQRVLNLPESNDQSMPRNRKDWNPQNLEMLKKWINGGAKDSDGKPMICGLGGSPC